MLSTTQSPFEVGCNRVLQNTPIEKKKDNYYYYPSGAFCNIGTFWCIWCNAPRLRPSLFVTKFENLIKSLILSILIIFSAAAVPVFGQEVAEKNPPSVEASSKEEIKVHFPYQPKKLYKRNYIDEVLADGCITKRPLTKEEIIINSDFQYLSFAVEAAAKSPDDIEKKPLLKCLLFSDQGPNILLERYRQLIGGSFYGMIERPGLYYSMIVSEACTSVVQFKITSLHPMICEEAILYDCCMQPRALN